MSCDRVTKPHVHTILLTQARYKCYQPVPADSLINATVAYYEKSGNKSLLCRAYYYRAMTLYDQGDHEEALRILKKGEELAVRNHDLLYMAKYHESLCMVNYQAKYHDLTLEYAKKFLEDAIRLKDTTYIVRGLEHVATAYSRMGEIEKGKDFIQKTLPLLSRMSRQDQAYILTNIGCFYHQQDSLTLAKHYLNLSLDTFKRPNTYAELGDIFAEENNLEEAEKCWSEALKSDNPTIIINTLESMSYQYKERKDYARALDILNQIYQIKDSLTQASEQAAIAEIQHKYDHQVVENKYYKTLTWLFGLAFGALAIIMLIIAYHRHAVRKYVSKLTLSRLAVEQATQEIKRLENSDVEHAKEVEKLKRKIANIRLQDFEEIGHGKEVFESVMANIPIKYHKDEESLIEYYSIFHHDTYSQWMETYKNLTTRPIVYLILLDIGKSDSEIQNILGISNGAIRVMKSRLNAKKA